MKKVISIIVGVVFLVFIAIAAIPLFYSIDDLRPKIIEAAEAKLQGKVEIGRLSLSTFPSITVGMEKVVLRAPAPFDKEPLMEMEQASVSIPLYSLLASPHLNIELKQPLIRLVSQKKKSNLNEFLPAEGAEAAAPSTSSGSSQAKATDAALEGIPSFLRDKVLNATISVVLDDATLETYELGAKKADHVSLSALNLSLENIGLNSPMTLDFSTTLDFKSGDTVLQGPVSSQGEISVKSNASNFDATFKLDNQLSDLKIVVGDLVNKKPGVDFKLSFEGTAEKKDVVNVNVKDFGFHFGELVLKSSLSVAKIDQGEQATIDFKMDSKPFPLASLADFLPMAASYSLGGNVKIQAAAESYLHNPIFSASIVLDKVNGSTPELSLPIKDLAGTIGVFGNLQNQTVKIAPFNMKVGSSDVKINGGVQNSKKISLKLNIEADRFNVDELMGTQSVEEAQKSAGAGGSATPPPATASNEPLDESLDKMAPDLDKALANPMLDKVSADISIQAKSLRASGAEFKKARVNLKYDNRNLSILDTGLDGFNGSLVMNADFKLVPKVTSYNIRTNLRDISLESMLATYAPSWQKELSGSVRGDFKLSGVGLTKGQLSDSLRGSLNGDILKGRTSIPVVKLISGILEKLPKKIEDPAKKKTGTSSFNGEFKTMKLNSTIVGRKINLDKMDIVFASESAGIGELQFLAKGYANFDRFVDMAGTAYMDPSKVRVQELVGSSGKVEIPMRFKGNMSDPKPDYGYSVNILAPRLAKGLLKSKAGKKVGEQVTKEIEKIKLPPKAKEELNNLKKKFGF